MESPETEYVERNYSAVDEQVREMARRERILTRRLNIENLKRMGVPLIQISIALAILIIALGILIWLIKTERVVEVEKIVEITREVPIVSEKVKVVEVPVYIEVPKYIGTPESGNPSSETQVENSPTFSNPPDVSATSENNEKLSAEVTEILEANGTKVGRQLNFALRWENTNDLDLHVELPNGETIFYAKPSLEGGRLDSDKNTRQGLTPRPIENIRWEDGAPSGTYKVYVSIYTDRSGPELRKTDFRLIIHENGKVRKTFTGAVDHNTLRSKMLVATIDFRN